MNRNQFVLCQNVKDFLKIYGVLQIWGYTDKRLWGYWNIRLWGCGVRGL